MPELQFFIESLQPVLQVLSFLLLTMAYAALLIGTVATTAAIAMAVHHFRNRNKK